MTKAKNKPDPIRNFFEKSIYIVAFLVPISNIPQLYNVWIKNETAGVSLLSWSLFAIFSVFWSAYGYYHKDKPVFYQSVALMIIQMAIAVGVVIYG